MAAGTSFRELYLVRGQNVGTQVPWDMHFGGRQVPDYTTGAWCFSAASGSATILGNGVVMVMVMAVSAVRTYAVPDCTYDHTATVGSAVHPRRAGADSQHTARCMYDRTGRS